MHKKMKEVTGLLKKNVSNKLNKEDGTLTFDMRDKQVWARYMENMFKYTKDVKLMQTAKGVNLEILHQKWNMI